MKNNEVDEVDGKILLWLIILVAIVFLITRIWSDTNYNNGICSNCGGHWKFVTAVGHKYTSEFYYKCDTCGRTITTDHLMDDE